MEEKKGGEERRRRKEEKKGGEQGQGSSSNDTTIRSGANNIRRAKGVSDQVPVVCDLSRKFWTEAVVECVIQSVRNGSWQLGIGFAELGVRGNRKNDRGQREL